MTEITREHLVRQAEDGVTITRQQLAATLQRLPRPAGAAGGGWPYSQALLLAFLACHGCDSCSRADNGGGYSCDCPVPCGTRYCQHAAAASQPGDRDEELEVIAGILSALDGLDAVDGDWRQSVARALTYIASRYGYVLAEPQAHGTEGCPGGC